MICVEIDLSDLKPWGKTSWEMVKYYHHLFCILRFGEKYDCPSQLCDLDFNIFLRILNWTLFLSQGSNYTSDSAQILHEVSLAKIKKIIWRKKIWRDFWRSYVVHKMGLYCSDRLLRKFISQTAFNQILILLTKLVWRVQWPQMRRKNVFGFFDFPWLSGIFHDFPSFKRKLKSSLPF